MKMPDSSPTSRLARGGETIRELDMGIPRDEIVAGIGRLVERLGGDPKPAREGSEVRFLGPGGIAIEIGPMPENRVSYPILFPRTLVRLRGEGEALEKLHREIVHAFLRPTG